MVALEQAAFGSRTLMLCEWCGRFMENGAEKLLQGRRAMEGLAPLGKRMVWV